MVFFCLFVLELYTISAVFKCKSKYTASHTYVTCMQVGESDWMGSIGAQSFSDLSSDVQSFKVQVWGLAGPLGDIHRVVL